MGSLKPPKRKETYQGCYIYYPDNSSWSTTPPYCPSLLVAEDKLRPWNVEGTIPYSSLKARPGFALGIEKSHSCKHKYRHTPVHRRAHRTSWHDEELERPFSVSLPSLLTEQIGY